MSSCLRCLPECISNMVSSIIYVEFYFSNPEQSASNLPAGKMFKNHGTRPSVWNHLAQLRNMWWALYCQSSIHVIKDTIVPNGIGNEWNHTDKPIGMAGSSVQGGWTEEARPRSTWKSPSPPGCIHTRTKVAGRQESAITWCCSIAGVGQKKSLG